MNKIFISKKVIYVFYIFVVMLFVYAFVVFTQFEHTKHSIREVLFDKNKEYIDNIAQNIVNNLQKEVTPLQSLKTKLQNDKKLRKKLEQNLELFVTKKYRYIYIVTKEKNKKRFLFLLDGAKEDKSDFLEEFIPLKMKKWLEVYQTKQPLFFQNKDTDGLWMTYLYPVMIQNKIEGILAIDFSLTEEKNIESILDVFIQSSKTFIFLSLLVLSIVLLLLFYEMKKTKIIKEQSAKIRQFNVTLQKRIEEEVEKNREKDRQILEQSRLAQLGEMLGMIAHQWRQPLSAISAASITLNMKAQMDMLEKQSTIEIADKIADLIQHLSKTIDDFRDFFKNTKEKKEITYHELINTTLEIVEASLKNKNIDVIIEEESQEVFQTYANELKQVLLNLIKNAEDILLEKKVEKPYIKIITQGNRLKVYDNGGGIPEDIIDKIFDPYFSTKSLNGTGLGLYMSKTIIEEHCQGKLSVKNEKDGAVFTIELPSREKDEKDNNR